MPVAPLPPRRRGGDLACGECLGLGAAQLSLELLRQGEGENRGAVEEEDPWWGRGALWGVKLLGCRVEPKTVCEAESRMVGRVKSRREHVCAPTRTRICPEAGRGGQCGESPLLWLGTLGSKLVIPDKLFVFHFPE